MPREASDRIPGRSLAVREYGQWIDAMSECEYDSRRTRYNRTSSRVNIESFEDCIFSFDQELEEYLQMNREAGFRSGGPFTLIRLD